MRILLPLVLAVLSLPGPLSAQVRAQIAAQPDADDCRIGIVGVARSGVGFVCDRATDGPILIVASSGVGEAHTRLVHEWAVRARDTGNARAVFTVRHREPSPAAQEVCDQFALPGPDNRDPAPMRCRELEAAYRR